ncbi:MAG: VCBS repeat-containing protein [Planctomycetes bacterium]|nr:VCBS repeat-containing protein [Planctomycetota bacterium]
MLAPLLLSLAPQAALVPHVEVRDADGYEYAGALEQGRLTLVLPTVTTNERAPRLVANSKGLGVRLAAPVEGTSVVAASLRVIEHPAEQRVLLVDGEPRLFTEPVLPAYARDAAGRDWLPELARYDLALVEFGDLELPPPPEGSVLVLQYGEEPRPQPSVAGLQEGANAASVVGGGVYFGAERAPLAAWIPPEAAADSAADSDSDSDSDSAVPAIPKGLWDRVNPFRVDQASFARPCELDAASLRACALQRAWVYRGAATTLARRHGRGPARPLAATSGLKAEALTDFAWPVALDAGGVLELRFASPPPPAQGKVQTYLLEVVADVEPAATRPPVATEAAQRPWFVDRAPALGLATVHFEGPDDQRDIRPTMGPGAAWGDVDGDGWQDLLVVQGGGREGCATPVNRLYRNVAGRFTELQTLDDGAGMGALFFDLDGDGDLDLYQANYGADRLYVNDGRGRFEDVSAAQGIGGDLWSAGVCAGDVDGDGDLDLYVTSYLDYDLEKLPPVEQLAGMRREDPVEMLPFAFPGQRNTFYENRGGKLVDVTEARGLLDVQGRGMQAVFWDFDRDGDLDLYAANDVSFNVLFRNDGAGHFEDVSFQTGMDDPRGGMGVALGDVDGDGDEDLFLANWQLEANALYLNNYVATAERKVHVGTFQDGTVRSGLGPAGVGVTSWGAVLFDVDNDGDLDLFVPNGYTSPDYESTGICVGQRNQLFLNDGEGRFEDASARAGDDVTCALASRAAAACDYDRDGRLDLFVTNNNGPYQLLRNELATGNHWLGLDLRMDGPNPYAVGAWVELEAGDLRLVRTLRLGEGYLTGHAPELHFGLGPNDAVARLVVHWPDGRTSEHAVDGVDRWLTLTAPPR